MCQVVFLLDGFSATKLQLVFKAAGKMDTENTEDHKAHRETNEIKSQ